MIARVASFDRWRRHADEGADPEERQAASGSMGLPAGTRSLCRIQRRGRRAPALHDALVDTREDRPNGRRSAVRRAGRRDSRGRPRQALTGVMLYEIGRARGGAGPAHPRSAVHARRVHGSASTGTHCPPELRRRSLMRARPVSVGGWPSSRCASFSTRPPPAATASAPSTSTTWSRSRRSWRPPGRPSRR